METLANRIVQVMDVLLGWLLRLPSDAQLFAVAVGSALVLALVRIWTTDRDLLQRCTADKKRLKALIRHSKAHGDHSSLAHHRATHALVAMKQLRQEGRPLLASLLPIVLLATWSFQRLEFHPLKEGEHFDFVARFPASTVGKLAHLVPVEGLRAHTGWMQEISAASAGEGIATWNLSGEARTEPYVITGRFERKTFEHRIRVGSLLYEAPTQLHPGAPSATEAALRPVKLFGIVPGIPAIGFPAWLVAYLVIVVPATFAIKKLVRIA